MDNDKLHIVVDNDKEWRKYIIWELREIKSDQKRLDQRVQGLSSKVAILGAFFGAFFASGITPSILLGIAKAHCQRMTHYNPRLKGKQWPRQSRLLGC